MLACARTRVKQTFSSVFIGQSADYSGQSIGCAPTQPLAAGAAFELLGNDRQPMRNQSLAPGLVVLIWLTGSPAGAQSVANQPPTVEQAPPPITGVERINWIVEGMLGPRSLAVGVIASTWQTSWRIPDEWSRSAFGFRERYLEREADVAISNTIEAGLGALWGEDPRYIRAPRGSVRSRAAHAAKTVVLAPRADGQLKPAWGRFAGNVFNNVIENAWLPPSMTTPGQTALRSANGLLGRLAGNLWDEFWPDIRTRLGHRSRQSTE